MVGVGVFQHVEDVVSNRHGLVEATEFAVFTGEACLDAKAAQRRPSPEDFRHIVPNGAILRLYFDGLFKLGFPIWLWYRIARTKRCALISGART